MGNLRKIVGVGLAIAIVAGLAVYLLIPKTGTTVNNVVVSEPQPPANSGAGDTTSGGSTTGGGSSGSGPSPPPTTPPTDRPPKAHGQNSHGPKHVICLPTKDHPGNGVSQYQGANQYRGQCPAGSAYGALGHGQGHGHQPTTTASNVAPTTLFYAVPADGVYGLL